MKQFSLLVLAAVLFLPPHAAARQACRDWQTCRQLALEAAERKEYDAFHDLAWRAVNAGPRNSPELMTLLARAQSLSGRPHDALVMLNRLAAMGVVTDAATSDDFSGVRELPGWPELEAKLAGKSAPSPPPPAAPKPPAPESSATIKEAAPAVKDPGASATEKPVKTEKPDPEPTPATSSTPPISAATPARKPKAGAAKVPPAAPAPLSFSAKAVDAVGLGYDAVSGRFIVGDRRDRRLLVIGERSGRLSSLAGVDGFDEITAFEIDKVEGDLWVVSTSSESRLSTVHKLQLISGRVLGSITLTPEQGTARFTDIVVTPQSVLVLDSEGRRVFRLAKKGKALTVATRVPAPGMTSLAPASDGTAYATYDQGLLKIDLDTGSLLVVEPREGVDLTGLTWVRWFRGSLIGIQNIPAGSPRLVRVRLDAAGGVARSIEPLDEGAIVAGPTSAGLAGSTLHYLGRANGTDSIEVRKVGLK
jgi:hypothetical protein